MATKQKIKIKCKACGGLMQEDKFYASNISEYKKLYNGYCPYCKECLQKLACDVNGHPDITALKNVLKNYLNKPFFNDTFLKVLKKKSKNILGDYLSILNLNRGITKNTVWEDGETEDIKGNKNKNSIPNDLTTSDFEVTKEMVRFWGRGKNYTPEDYQFLEETFKEWTDRNKCDTISEKKTYKFLCLKELEIMKGRENGDNVDKLEETYRKLLSDGGLTPKDANAANDPDNMTALGIWVRDIEKYTPAEYFKKKKLYQDFDELKDYLNRLIFRPIKNLLTGSKEFDKVFNVEDKNDVDEE